MLKEAYLSDVRRYVSRTQWEPAGLFSEGLCNATLFNLKLGFFSSSAISLLSYGFAQFLYNNGRMRMVINDILSAEDKAAVSKGLSPDMPIPAIDFSDIAGLREVLDDRGVHFFECLSWLIRQERIGIKITAPKEGVGISHFKCGYFADATNKVAFEGSCNFSRTALLENNESLSIFCDWDGPSDVMRVETMVRDFERTYSGQDDTVAYLAADDIKTRIVNAFRQKEMQSLLDDERRMMEAHEKDSVPATVRSFLCRAKEKVEASINREKSRGIVVPDAASPHFPFPSGPRPYQKLAFDNWKSKGQKGLFVMATGTGKTIAALNCLLEIYKSRHYYKALILAPTVTLVDQWKAECGKFGFRHVVTVSSKNREWRKEIANLLLLEKTDITQERHSYVIIATYASFARENVFHDLVSFPRKKLLFIADEVHNMGAASIKNRLSAIHYGRRIGLSATPERPFDDEGNSVIRRFFGAEDGYTFEFSMREAIDKGFLCRYYYYPHLVRLTDVEMTAYLEISKKLAAMFNCHTGTFGKNDSILTALLLKRKRIVHKAANKLDAFRDIIAKLLHDKGNLKYTLVYVPEGNATDGGGADDFDAGGAGDDYTSHLIDAYTSVVRAVSPSSTVMRFTSSTQERELMLKQFAAGELEVLTSMKCLDEGVDVPRTETAVFCASTGNPRQFIQRRGRILRQHPDKHHAVIHDLVVAPEVSMNSASYKMERSLLGGELKRVRNFALLSENADAALVELETVLDYYKLSIF